MPSEPHTAGGPLLPWARALLEGPLLGPSLKLGAMMVCANVLGYVFRLAMGRLLGPVEFATLAALLGLLAVMDRPLGALQANVAHHVARAERSETRQIGDFIRKITGGVIILAGIAAAGLGLLSPWAADALEVPRGMVAILGLGVVLAAPISVLTGVLNGQKRYVPLGLPPVIGSVVRLVLGVGLVLGGLGVLGGVIAAIARAGAALIVGLALVGWPERGGGSDVDVGGFVRYSLPVAIGLLSFAAMTNLDVVAAKFFLPPTEAGAYAGASVLGKVVLFIPAAVGLVLFPEASDETRPEDERRSLLIRALLVTLTFSLPAAILYAVFPQSIATLVLGEPFAASGTVLPLLGAGMTLMALVGVLTRYAIATRRLVLTYAISALVLLEAGLFTIFHGSPTSLALAVAVTGAAATILGLWGLVAKTGQ